MSNGNIRIAAASGENVRVKLPDAAILAGPDTFSQSASTELDRWALEGLQRAIATAQIRLRLWDGFELAPAAGLRLAQFGSTAAAPSSVASGILT